MLVFIIFPGDFNRDKIKTLFLIGAMNPPALTGVHHYRPQVKAQT